MLGLATTRGRDLLKHLTVTSNKVHEGLWAHSEVISDVVVEVKGSVYHGIGILVEDVHDRVEHGGGDLLQGLLRPAFVPNDNALVEEGWVLRAVLGEILMLIIKRDHNAEVLLDSAHEELKERPALVLVPHLVLKLSKQGLELFG